MNSKLSRIFLKCIRCKDDEKEQDQKIVKYDEVYSEEHNFSFGPEQVKQEIEFPNEKSVKKIDS